MTTLTLPQIGDTPPKRSSSDHKIAAGRKVKTLGTGRDSQDSMQIILQAKLRLKTQRNAKRKGAHQLNTQLERYYHKQEQKLMNEIDSSDEQKSIHANFKVIDNTHGMQSSIRNSRGKLSSLHTERTYTVEQSALVGKDVVKKFYNVHKDLERIEEIQKFAGKITPITMILRLLKDLHLPPKKLEVIRDKGNQNILDLRNCGLGKGNAAKVIHEVLDKLAYFDTINISHNSIHFNIIGELIPQFGKLKNIDLSYNKIGKQGCVLLSLLFKDNTTKIQVLQLESNELSDNSGFELLRHIFGYKKLKLLNLSKNNLSRDTALMLSKYLIEDGLALTQLYLHWNEIHEEGSLPLFQSLSNNKSVRVLDFSWNHQRQSAKMISGLKKFIENNKTCIHFDISYCNITYDSSREAKKSLGLNSTIYGIHYEGNHGFIDSRGNLILEDKTGKFGQVVQYPMPLVKSVARRIRGLEECSEEGCFGIDQRKNICWICQGYQEFEFRLPKTREMDGLECFVHLDREGFRGFKLLEKDNEFFMQKMLPKGEHRFFFTVGRDNRMTSEHYDKIQEDILIQQYRIGRVRFLNIFLKETNIIRLDTSIPPIDPTDFLPNIECRPRQKLNRINLKNLVLRKRLIERLQRMKFNLKQLPVVKQFRPSQQKMRDIYGKCLQFDFQNSKILNLLNLQNSAPIRQILLKNYKYIICAYDRLSCYNATEDGNYSIPQQSIIDLSQQVRWVTKRIPISKILVKYVSTLRKDGTMKRPQFIEFLIRVAEEKWAREDKQYFKSSFHLANMEKDRQLQRSRRDWRKESEIGTVREGTAKEGSMRGSFRGDSMALMMDAKDQDEQDDSKSITKSIAKSISKKARQTLTLEKGLQRILRPIVNFYHKYNPQGWRNARFMTPDIRLLLDVYEPFTRKLFEKYAKQKIYQKFKTISLHDFVTMFLKAGIATSRSKFDQGEVSFIMSRTIQVNDNQPFTLGYEQTFQAIGRLADLLNLPPIGYASNPIFASQKHRADIPLVFKMQSLLFLLYKCHPEISNAKVSSMFEQGIFKEQIDTYIELATQKYMNQTDFFLEPRINTRIKFNQMNGLSELTLKDLISALKLKYSNTMIRKYSLVEELHEDDEEDQDPPQ